MPNCTRHSAQRRCVAQSTACKSRQSKLGVWQKRKRLDRANGRVHATVGDMNHSPHAAPATSTVEAGEQVFDPSQVAAPVEPPYFAVSLRKLTVMSLCSLGYYRLYWLYRNWMQIRANGEPLISPARRTVLDVVYLYACFSRIDRRARSIGVSPTYSAGILTTGLIAVALLSWLPAPYSVVGVLDFVFLLPVQACANRINQAVAPGHAPNARIRGWDWLVVVLGGLTVLGALIVAFLTLKAH